MKLIGPSWARYENSEVWVRLKTEKIILKKLYYIKKSTSNFPFVILDWNEKIIIIINIKNNTLQC